MRSKNLQHSVCRTDSVGWSVSDGAISRFGQQYKLVHHAQALDDVNADIVPSCNWIGG
jgi:hypothetical protein